MSLLQDAFEKCTLLNKIGQPDGRGGIVYVWTEGPEFEAAITYNTSVQGKIAQAQGVKDLITVTTTKAVNLGYGTVFRRADNGQTYRVTTKGDDNKTPNSAGLDMRQVSAEEFELTGD